MYFLIIYSLIHIACGTLAFGIALAYNQRQFTAIAADMRIADIVFSCMLFLIGPIGLLASLITTGCAKHGLMYRLPSLPKKQYRG